MKRTALVLCCLGALLSAPACQPGAAPASPGEDAPKAAPPPPEPEPAPAPAQVEEAQRSTLAGAAWWNTPYPQPFDAKALARAPSRISVKDNHFVDESGQVVVLQGVSIADPDHLEREGQWKERLFQEVAAWGANVVRVPVHPAAWRGVGKGAYLRLLDEALVWANRAGLYVIVDWHTIGNLKTELFQHPMYDTTQAETFEFWRTIAFRYKDQSTFAFYELFNEPTVYKGTLGRMSWAEWKAMNEEMIHIIRAHDQKVIPLVAGFNWAYELGPVDKDPISAAGIAYVSHPYPMKTTAPFEKNWDRDFGFVTKKYPLFATEIGYMRKDGLGAHNPVIDDGSYGPRMTTYLAERGASWVAWVFHPSWSPQLISDWNYTPTESGAHFRKVMLERRVASTAAPPAVKPAAPPAAKP